MDVVPEPLPSKTAIVIEERKKKAPKVHTQIVQSLKIATPVGQDAPLSPDVPREPCQGSGTLKAQKSDQRKEVSGTTGTQSGAPKAPKEDQQTKQCQYVQDSIVFEGSSPLKAQKSGQAKEVNKRKAKADVKEKEGMAVLEQHNVKKLKKMKEMGVHEVAFEQKLAIDEVKMKGHTGKGQLEKVLEDKIALKRDGMKKKAKKYVEKRLEDKGPADKALALVGSSKRPKLQAKRAKQSRASSIASTIVFLVNRKKIEERAKNKAALTWDVLPCKAQKAMKKDTFIMDFVVNHMKMVNQKEEAMRKEIKSHVENGYKSRIKVGMLTVKGDEDKSNGGSDDDGDEDEGSSQDGGGNDDSNDGSDDDANDDDDGSDNDKVDGEDDGTDDKDDGTDDKDDGGDGDGSDERSSEGVSEQDDAQDVSTDEDEL
ncbi:hypothetical protein L7F22_011203 [Adiantum nelumboides]|nr:hypothetical protein [Adiantum nelumboides]